MHTEVDQGRLARGPANAAGLSPRARHQLARQVAAAYDGVLSRRLLRDLVGADGHDVARHVAVGRWRRWGSQTVAVHTAVLGLQAQRWRAVWEVGERIAAIDGVTALQTLGLSGFDDDRVHVSVLHTAQVVPVEGVVLHKVIRRMPGELTTNGLPTTAPQVAAVRAAHWAVSDRQAALVLAMPVQQGLTTPARLSEVVRAMPGRNRRRLVHTIVSDLADGARSLGELDFGALCRARGLPQPSRQVVRQGPRGRIYLDARFDCGLVVEIDGAGHRRGLAVMDDNLRANEVTLGRDRVLRIDLLGLRLAPDLFMSQVARGVRQEPPGSR